MRQTQQELTVATQGQGLYEVTGQVAQWLKRQEPSMGLLTLFCRHTSASLTIQENADPDVCRDLESFFRRLVREDASLYRHSAEGPDDMPAHIRAALTSMQLAIPVNEGRMSLGTWQGIYLFEHRSQPHSRIIVLHYLGD